MSKEKQETETTAASKALPSSSGSTLTARYEWNDGSVWECELGEKFLIELEKHYGETREEILKGLAMEDCDEFYDEPFWEYKWSDLPWKMVVPPKPEKIDKCYDEESQGKRVHFSLSNTD